MIGTRQPVLCAVWPVVAEEGAVLVIVGRDNEPIGGDAAVFDGVAMGKLPCVAFALIFTELLSWLKHQWFAKFRYR
jgi:hypothetical protein